MARFVDVGVCLLGWVGLLGLGTPVQAFQGVEVPELERFALAADRSAVLETMVPGTDDHFWLSCLHRQHQGELPAVDALLVEWENLLGRTHRWQQIATRQALLKFDSQPEVTRRYLTETFGLRFDHERRLPPAEARRPSILDPTILSRAAVLDRELRERPDLSGLTMAGLEQLDERIANLNLEQRRQLLRRVTQPDFPGLLELVAQELQLRDSAGFGALPIHSQLTTPQLEALWRRVPALGSNESFVRLLIGRFWSEVGPLTEATSQRVADLRRIVEFLRPLPASLNSLKAAALHELLRTQATMDEYDLPRFIEYIRLPRPQAYIHPARRERAGDTAGWVDLNRDFRDTLGCPPPGDDTPLVERFLQHFLADEERVSDFRDLLEDEFLTRQLAIAQILSGHPDPARWTRVLGPAAYRDLTQRVDLEFARTDKVWYEADEVVRLDLNFKNIDQWVVRIYELNTLNCYRDKLEPIHANLSLDGLVPNIERRFTRQQPPGVRTRETLELPELQGRGVFMIDLIGGGQNARLMVRKGRLLWTVQTTAGGHVLQVLDEQGQPLIDASAWVKGQRFEANEHGRIAIPFLPDATADRLIVQHGDFADLADVNLLPESWQLHADLHVDRETLLAGQTAQVLIRPQLSVAGNPVPVADRLEEVVFTIISVDLDGQKSQREFRNVSLNEQHETVVPFLVPPRLRTLSLELRGKVRVSSQNRDQWLTASQTVSLNRIDTTSQIVGVHLLPVANGYLGQIAGRNGEPCPGVLVSATALTRWSTNPVTFDLQTDEAGQIDLGALSDVSALTLGVAGGEARTWSLEDQTTLQWPTHLTVAANTAFRLPWAWGAANRIPPQASLYRVRRGVWHEAVAAKPTFAEGWLNGPALPEGDYVLKLNSGTVLPITVIEGSRVGRTLINSYRAATLSEVTRPTVVEVTDQPDAVLLRLDGFGPDSRVHLFASRYLPAFPAAQAFRGVMPPPTVLRQLRWDGNRYVSARTLGDEYLYIMDRQARERWAGSLLDRPSLLLAPWALGETTSGRESLARDQAMGEGLADAAAAAAMEMAQSRQGSAGWDDPANLDFLAESTRLLTGVRPNADGLLRLPREALGDKSCLTVVVVDLFATVVVQHRLAAVPAATVDLRLPEALPAEKPVALDKRVETLAAGQPFTVEDLYTARFETVASLQDAWTLMSAVIADQELAKFEFLIRWDELDPATQHRLYQEHACHEVNFFLYRRDPAYFAAVIRPLIAQRRSPTFLDQFLLEQDLTAWLQPWLFARLNVFEKLLLAQRLPAQRAGILRHLRDGLALLPPDEVDLDNLFEQALAGRGLDTDDFKRGEKLEQGLGQTENERAKELSERELDRGGQPTAGLGGSGGIANQPARPQSRARGGRRLEAPSDKPAAPGLETEGRYGKSLQVQLGDGLWAEAGERAGETKMGRGFFGGAADGDEFLAFESKRRFYQAIQPTQRWVEYHYWKTSTSTDTQHRVGLNRFWEAYAVHDPELPFLDWRFLLCRGNVSEAILALAVLDLDARTQEPKVEVEQRRLTWTSPQAVLMFHQQLHELPREPGAATVMVSENFFDHADRYQTIDNRRIDRFVTGPFSTRRLYGGLVVVTNPTSSPRSVRLLTQVPVGAIAVAGSRETQTTTIELPAFGSISREYWFYFPAAGEFTHFPAQVSDRNTILATAQPAGFTVVDPSAVDDRQSWEFVSQNGTDAELVAWLDRQDVLPQRWDDLRWRMRERKSFQTILDYLSQRFIYSSELWSYAVQHLEPHRLREFLERDATIPAMCGPIFSSPILENDPELRGWYEHIEYAPLLNARSHQVGLRRRILNPNLAAQYTELLNLLAHRARLTDEDRLAVVYYLLTQERIEEATKWLAEVSRDAIVEQMPYDYAVAWLALIQMDAERAQAIAQPYLDHPLPRWQQRFAAVRQVVEEAAGAGAKLVDPDSALQQQLAAAAAEASVDIEATPDGISLRYRNAPTLRVQYYRMDVELLFSRDPFGSQNREGLTLVKPTMVELLEIPAGETQRIHRLPEALRRANVMIEVIAGQQTATTTVYANNLDVQVVASMGQLQVRSRDRQQVLPATYVKVYGQRSDGQVIFLKDGYTDLRGRFDYVTQSSTPLAGLQKLAIMVSHDEQGSLIRQADLP